MTVKEKILDSIQPVIANAKYVSIEAQAVLDLAKKLKETDIPHWNNEMQFLSNEDETVQYYFFIDSTQGCTWPAKDKDRWHFEKDGEWMRGYYAFAYAIKKAVLADKKYLDAEYLSQINFGEFEKIFRGKGDLQMLPQRHESLKQNFQILKEKYDGLAANLVRGAGKDINKLVFTMVKEMPTFDDKAVYNAKEVYFWKRAQIFPNDIHFALQGKGVGEFHNMDALAIFADYKLPQLLESHGVLKYNEGLRQKLINEEILPSGCSEEVEIRAYTIHACELLIQELQKLGRQLTSQQLDWILWNLSRQKDLPLPHHRTPTIYY